MTEEKKPIHTISAGCVHVSIWENLATNKEGKEFPTISAKVEKRYSTDGEEWKSTNSYNKEDIAKLKVCVDELMKFMLLTK